MLVRRMALVGPLRLVRGESLRQCAEALDVPRTTLMENIPSGRFLPMNQARQVGWNLGPYAPAAGFDDGVGELFLRAYAFEAKLRDCLADRAFFEAAVSCASRVLKAYFPEVLRPSLPGRFLTSFSDASAPLRRMRLPWWPATSSGASAIARTFWIRCWRVITRAPYTTCSYPSRGHSASSSTQLRGASGRCASRSAGGR